MGDSIMLGVRSLVLGGFLLGVGFLVTTQALGELRSSPLLVDGLPAFEGTLVGKGTPLPDREGCHFDEPVGWTIHMARDDPNRGYLVTSTLSEDCELRIATIVPSPGADLPGVATPLREVSEAPADPIEGKEDEGDAASMTTWYGPKKVNMRWWTHGACPTCTWDMLTEVYDSITFSWTHAPDYLARIDSYYAGCKWSSGTAWYNDRCAYESWDFGPSHPRVHIKNAGDFHWTNDWYYTHTLRQELWGDYIGEWDCTGWITGSYVYGPAQNCWQD